MNPTTCPHCKAIDDISMGYGYAGGILGAYVICNACDHVIELKPEHAGTIDDPHPIVMCKEP